MGRRAVAARGTGVLAVFLLAGAAQADGTLAGRWTARAQGKLDLSARS